jgi:chloramphenicol 3-O phosphotransferase
MINKRIVFIGVLLIVGIIGIWYMKKSQCREYQPGRVIILNGPSASGKSSIQKELVKLFDTPYLLVGIDNFFVGVLPQQFVMGPIPRVKTPEDVVMTGVASHDEHGPLFTLHVGPAGRKVIAGMHAAIAAYARQGNNVIVDYILYEPEWLHELVCMLDGIQVYFVGVDISLTTLEERERVRATSPVGHARSHYDSVHAHDRYDLRINTGITSALECAQSIKKYIDSGVEPQAFDYLRKQFSCNAVCVCC